jgi:hypothetical protein
MTVIVTETDYRAAKKINGFLLASHVYLCQEATGPFNRYRYDIVKEPRSLLYGRQAKREQKLFVPGMSRSVISFDEQDKVTSLTKEEFSKRLEAQPRGLAWHIWYTINRLFAKYPSLNYGQPWMSLLLVSLIVLPAALLIKPSLQSYMNQPQMYQLTTFNDGHLETLAIPKDDWPEMKDEYTENKHNVLLKAIIISEPRQVGGAQVVFKVRTEKTGNLQGGGFAAKSLGLQKGDVIYFRWADPLFDGMYGAGMRWVITEAEAKVLLSQGYKLSDNLE